MYGLNEIYAERYCYLRLFPKRSVFVVVRYGSESVISVFGLMTGVSGQYATRVTMSNVSVTCGTNSRLFCHVCPRRSASYVFQVLLLLQRIL